QVEGQVDVSSDIHQTQNLVGGVGHARSGGLGRDLLDVEDVDAEEPLVHAKRAEQSLGWHRDLSHLSLSYGQQVPDLPNQSVVVELARVAAVAAVPGLDLVGDSAQGREREHRRLDPAAARLAGELPTVHDRHLDVRDNQVEGTAGR